MLKRGTFNQETSKSSEDCESDDFESKIARKSMKLKSAVNSNLITTVSKQSFDTLISAQHITGYWGAEKISIFSKFFKNGQVEDSKVRLALQNLSASTLSQNADIEALYTTLLAIFVL